MSVIKEAIRVVHSVPQNVGNDFILHNSVVHKKLKLLRQLRGIISAKHFTHLTLCSSPGFGTAVKLSLSAPHPLVRKQN